MHVIRISRCCMYNFTESCRGDSMRHSKLVLASILQSLVLNDLNPIIIRVQYEGNIPHAAICKSLFPVNTLVLESLAS